MLIVLLALSVVPPTDVCSETVDVVEVNHFYDDQGRLVFDQVIFYDWHHQQSHYHVRAWRLIKTPSQIPRRCHSSQFGYVTIWHDGYALRRVVAISLRETWTQYDPELLERELLPKQLRCELMPFVNPRPRSDRPQSH